MTLPAPVAPPTTQPPAPVVDERLLAAQLDEYYDRWKGGQRKTEQAMDVVRQGTLLPTLWAHLFQKAKVAPEDGERMLREVEARLAVGGQQQQRRFFRRRRRQQQRKRRHARGR
jgi:hypothetical protein